MAEPEAADDSVVRETTATIEEYGLWALVGLSLLPWPPRHALVHSGSHVDRGGDQAARVRTGQSTTQCQVLISRRGRATSDGGV